MNIECEGNSLKLSKIIKSIFKYKWTNLLILLTFWALGYLYYISQKPVYGATATVEIKNVAIAKRDFFGNAIGETAGIETEIDIIKSNRLIEKTLKQLGNNVSYFQKKEPFGKEQIYDTAPFVVKNFIVYNPKLLEREISIVDLGEGKFHLAPKFSMKEKVLAWLGKPSKLSLGSWKKVYRFNQVYLNDDMAFLIVQKRSFTKKKYAFSLSSIEHSLSLTKRNLKVAPASTDSTILQLDFKACKAKRAQDFLNALVKNYIDYSVKNLTSTDRKKLEFVNSQLETINEALANSEDRLEGFKVDHDISNIQAQIEDVIAKVGTIEEKLQVERVNYRAIMFLIKELRAGNFSVASSLEGKYPILATLVQNLQELTRKREALLVNLTRRHPKVIIISKEIAQLKKSIAEIVFGIKKQTIEKKSALEKDLALYKEKLRAFPNKEKELARKERVFKVNDDVYNYLLQKQSELSIEKVSHSSNKEVLDYAKMAKKLNLKLPLVLILSTVLGIFTILLHSIMREKFDVHVKTPEDISEQSELPLFGIIPFVEDKEKYNSAYVLEDTSSTASEAFRAVRTNLDYIVSPHGSKVVLITSSVPNEGKTAVAANLASVIGMSEKKAIILSLDLRRPEMHHKFGLSNKVGMSDVLSGKAALKDVIWKHEIHPNLHIITSGRIPPNPAELLASGRMQEVIHELRKEYDYVILDTPPVNYVSDAAVLFKYADMILFVVKSEFTSKEQLRELDSMTKKLGLENVGVILNSVKSKNNKLEQFDYKYLYFEPL